MTVKDFKAAANNSPDFNVYRALQDVRVATPAATKTAGGKTTSIFPDTVPDLSECLPLHQQIVQQNADQFAHYAANSGVEKALDDLDSALDRLYLMSTNADHADHKDAFLKRDQVTLDYLVKALDKSDHADERFVQAVKLQCDNYAPELIAARPDTALYTLHHAPELDQ